jgi:single-stranded-DNA-specific exonuclease
VSVVDRLLEARGIVDKNSFLNPDYDSKIDPFDLSDMDKAVCRIKDSLKSQEKITIYGDYDVDGITSTVLLLESLNRFGFKNVNYFIPNRFDDGYGLNVNSVKKIIADGTKLIITVDCGSGSIKEAELLKENNIDLIITDHHEIDLKKIPIAIAVVNPKKDCQRNDFSGVGVAFKLVQALQTTLVGLPKGQEKWFLDLVAMGTICDSVKLLNENRANVYWGLKVMQKSRHIGLQKLINISGLSNGSVDSYSVGFVIGPRINAAGRIKNADIAVKSFISEDENEVNDLIKELEDLNDYRRNLQEETYKEAIGAVDSNDNAIVVSSDNWHKGVIGIVASKLVDLYQKPAFVITNKEDLSSGSARSIDGVDISEIIKTCKNEGILLGGGGHKMAGGITLKKENIPKFRKRVNALCQDSKIRQSEKYKEDISISLEEISIKLVDELKTMEPFGVGNERPIFRTTKVKIVDLRHVGAKDYIKLTVCDDKKNYFELISFEIDSKTFPYKQGSIVDIWYSATDNVWMGNRNVQGRLYQAKES